MRTFLKFCFLGSFLFILEVQASAKKETTVSYLQYVDEITNDFVKEMENETGLSCRGSGGSMPYDVEEFDIMLVGYRRATQEEARALMVTAIQKLLKKINEHEKIRHFLREHPFTESRASISIAFQTNHGTRYLDGSIALVFNARNKIFYERAENQLVKYPPVFDARTGGIDSPAHEKVQEKLVRLAEEPYEEAVQIVAAMPKQYPFKKLR